MVFIGVILLVIFAGGFLWWSNRAIVLTEYVYESEKQPEAFAGFRITQVSDLQSQYFGKNQRRLLKRVAESRPDIIVFTGDLVDRNHTDYEAGLIAMRGLIAIAPVYYVDGNHEIALPEEDISQFYDELQKIGVHLLFDRSETVERDGARIRLFGLRESTVEAAKEEAARRSRRKASLAEPERITEVLDRMTGGRSAEEPGILLAHEPQFFSTYCREGIDLIFAGHAHGGQIRLPFTEGLFAPGQGFLPKLTRGIHRHHETTMIISRGLGNSVFPFRIFNRPEIVVTELQKADSSGSN